MTSSSLLPVKLLLANSKNRRNNAQFVALLLDPPKPNKSLKRAAAAHTKLIKR